MSSPNFSLYLAPQAEVDIEAILQYSYQEYGAEQERKYAAALREGLQLITDNPYIGRRRFNILPDYRVWRVQQHLLVYKIRENDVYVARVLHNRMDISRHL